MKEIFLDNWDEFERVLRSKMKIDSALVRNFALVTFDGINLDDPLETDSVEVNSLVIARKTGTDRRQGSAFWNVPFFDHDHELYFVGKKPDEITYAFLVDLRCEPYLVSVSDGKGGVNNEDLDLTANLSEHDGVLVYDPSLLYRAAHNEYWFKGDPLSAALLLFTLKPTEE